jgi:hypothetical protein
VGLLEVGVAPCGRGEHLTALVRTSKGLEFTLALDSNLATEALADIGTDQSRRLVRVGLNAGKPSAGVWHYLTEAVAFGRRGALGRDPPELVAVLRCPTRTRTARARSSSQTSPLARQARARLRGREALDASPAGGRRRKMSQGPIE